MTKWQQERRSLLKILVTAEMAMGAGEMLSLPPHWTLLSLKAAGG